VRAGSAAPRARGVRVCEQTAPAMITSAATNRPVREEPLERPVPSPPRGAEGLTVVVAPAGVLATAGAMLRSGPALGLVPTYDDPLVAGALVGGVPLGAPDPGELDRVRVAAAGGALAALAGAGMEVRAVETVPAGEVEARLAALAGEDVACVVVATRSARTARRLARAAHAPVLAVPPGAAPARGPAVLAAADAQRLAPACARCLATTGAALVAGFDPVPVGTLARSAAHPLLVPRLLELAELHRWEALDAAEHEADMGVVLAGEHGLEGHPVLVPEPVALAGLAGERAGVAVVADRGALRTPLVLRESLAAGRPALLVP